MIRLAIQQRVIPTYRAPFFELLASHPDIKLGVFAGEPRENEQIKIAPMLANVDYHLTKNIHLLNGSLYFCMQPEFKKWVAKWNPALLLVEANPRYLSTPQAISWMKRNDKPVIGWGLGVPQYQGFLSGWRNHSRSKFLKSLDAIIAYSQKGANQYRNAGFKESQIYVAINATAPAPTSSPPQRASWADRKPILLYVGRLQWRKKLDLLIETCAKLPEDIQPQLWIVGEGDIRGELEDLAQKVYPKTKFWGEKFGDELIQIYSRSDLFVLPGTGGLAVQQAMSFALPVIVAEGDGTQSDLIDQTNGWIINPEDPQALFESILQALTSPDRLQIMGIASYKTVKERINIENMVSVFVKACNDALSKGKKV